MTVTDMVEFPLSRAVHIFPGDSWARLVRVAGGNGAPRSLVGWSFVAAIGEHALTVDASGAASGEILVTASPAVTSAVLAGEVFRLTGTSPDGTVSTFVHGPVTFNAPPSTPARERMIIMATMGRGDKGQDGDAVSTVIADRAESARDASVAASGSAAGSAAAASGHAGAASSARGSAESAAATAGSAASSAGMSASAAHTARTGAETARGAAESAASAAGGSASNASAFGAAAQAAKDAAETARTDAQTARTGAETAQTGAQSARADAEAARDLALAGQFAGTQVPNSGIDLDTLWATTGRYRFNSAAATASLNMPTTLPGILDVSDVTLGGTAIHRYTVYSSSNSGRVVYQRIRAASAFQPWRAFTASRTNSPVDQPGFEMFLWNEINNVEQRVQPIGIDLGTINLDLITLPGSYMQNNSARATLANNYPQANGSGTLEVIPVSATRFTHRYSVHNGVTGVLRGIYQRRCFDGVFGSWFFIPAQRVDQAAGRAIYTWDDLNVREQLIYGDTGIRDLRSTGMMNGWSAGSIMSIRRVGQTVRLVIDSMSAAGATDNQFLAIPTGFRPDQVSRDLLHTVAPSVRRTSAGGAVLQCLGWSAADTSLHGNITWFTNDSWPTALPGTAIGAIPNN